MEVDVLKRVPVREQDPKVRATNFEEVCYGYNKEEAMAEASRCLNCKNAQCMKGCPVSINIPAFVEQVKNGDFTKAYEIISESSALPAVCGRVCPQESQCEGKCIRGFKGDPVSIGKLERFVADTARENGIKPKTAAEKNGKKVAVIGSGPAGLTCAGDLAKLGYDVTILTTDQNGRPVFFSLSPNVKHIDLGINYGDGEHDDMNVIKKVLGKKMKTRQHFRKLKAFLCNEKDIAELFPDIFQIR